MIKKFNLKLVNFVALGAILAIGATYFTIKSTPYAEAQTTNFGLPGIFYGATGPSTQDIESLQNISLYMRNQIFLMSAMANNIAAEAAKIYGLSGINTGSGSGGGLPGTGSSGSGGGVVGTPGTGSSGSVPPECPSLRGERYPWYGNLYGFVFPQPYQTVFEDISLPTNGPRVVELRNVGTTAGRNLGSIVVVPNFDVDASTHRSYMSISKCPGDFGVEGGRHLPVGRCVYEHSGGAGSGPNFKIITEGEQPDPLFCNLVRGQTYYFNHTTYDDRSSLMNGAFCQTASVGTATQGGTVIPGGTCRFYLQMQAG